MASKEYKMYSEEEEAAFDIVAARNLEHPVGRFFSSLNLIKGALGSGILGGHVVFMKAGYMVSVICTVLLGVYVSYSLYMIVSSAQIMYRRTRVHTMSYPELGEAVFLVSGRETAKKHAKCLRYTIDAAIGFELFGACCSYQIIMSKSLKQLVENVSNTGVPGKGPGYPPLQVYTAIIWIPCVLLSFVNRFSALAKVSLVGNFIVLICSFSTVYYWARFNPSFSNMKPVGTVAGFFELCGVVTFSMSCVGGILPVENHLKNTYDYKCVHYTSYVTIVVIILLTSFFGYAAFTDHCEAPITVNYPMELYPKILKVLIIFLVLTTHAINFWIPFQLVWVYAKRRHQNSKHLNCIEMLYKIGIITGINILAILFPDVTAVMGFLGTLTLSLLIFVLPNLVEIYVYLGRGGFGRGRWRLYKCIILMTLGICICISGSYFNGRRLIQTFAKAFGGK